MSLRSENRFNGEEIGPAQMTAKQCGLILARRIVSLRKFGIENVWIRLNEVLNSEYDASRVLGFEKDEFRAMLVSLGVINQKGFSILRLRLAIGCHEISVEHREHKHRESGDYAVDLKHVRFGFYGSERTEVYESIQPNASAHCLYNFLQARDGRRRA
jgi:hypothetical protein